MAFLNDYKNMGGRVTVSSDAGFIYNLFGFGTIAEMELLQEAGFHPLEVIRGATLHGAQALYEPKRKPIEFGVVRAGLLADLVIVPENPIANLKVLYGTGAVRLNEKTGHVRTGGWHQVHDQGRHRVRRAAAPGGRRADGGKAEAGARHHAIARDRVPGKVVATVPPAHESRNQCADAVLMVRPARFGSNPETADSNRFQHAGATAADAAAAAASSTGSPRRLADAGVEVIVADDSPEPAKPDACFPNNWVSFHADGSVVLYPMMAPSRRAERRREPIAAVERAGYRVARTIDLSPLEARGEFLEGTGSLVLDRPSRIAYACLSPRTTPAALAEFSAALGYRIVAFDALGPDGRPAYHTNVLMAIGEGFAVVCAESIRGRRSPRGRPRGARARAAARSSSSTRPR